MLLFYLSAKKLALKNGAVNMDTATPRRVPAFLGRGSGSARMKEGEAAREH
jgi:hypothetical protein